MARSTGSSKSVADLERRIAELERQNVALQASLRESSRALKTASKNINKKSRADISESLRAIRREIETEDKGYDQLKRAIKKITAPKKQTKKKGPPKKTQPKKQAQSATTSKQRVKSSPSKAQPKSGKKQQKAPARKSATPAQQTPRTKSKHVSSSVPPRFATIERKRVYRVEELTHKSKMRSLPRIIDDWEANAEKIDELLKPGQQWGLRINGYNSVTTFNSFSELLSILRSYDIAHEFSYRSGTPKSRIAKEFADKVDIVRVGYSIWDNQDPETVAALADSNRIKWESQRHQIKAKKAKDAKEKRRELSEAKREAKRAERARAKFERKLEAEKEKRKRAQQKAKLNSARKANTKKGERK